MHALIRAIEECPDPVEKRTRVAEVLRRVRHEGAPLIEGDTRVTFLYHGPAEKVGLIGDMTDWCGTEYFQRISDTELWYLSAEYPAEARLEYQLLIDDRDLPLSDPLNPHRSLNGLGTLSELAMPRYRYHPYFQEYRTGRKGRYQRIESHEIPAGCLGYPHTIHVYRPPGYDTGETKYTTVYFQDGEDYIEFAQVTQVLNRLIGEGKIPPLIAVFEAPPNRHLPEEPNRMFQYGLNDTYCQFFVAELVPFVETRYRCKPSPENRLVVGDSFGGLISGYIAFRHPEVFGLAYSQSGYQSFQNDRLIEAFRESPPKPLRLFVDVGHYERCVGKAFLPAEETDFLAANRRFREVLAAKGYDFVYREYPEGHTWGNWRRHLIDGLIHFFGSSHEIGD